MSSGDPLANDLEPSQCCTVRGETFDEDTYVVHLDCAEPLEGQAYQDCTTLAAQGEVEPWRSVYTYSASCVAANPCGDADNDGVRNLYDCDDLNSLLSYDLDTDGVCDRPAVFDENACIDECNSVYSDSSEHESCVSRCQHPDNCPCIDGTACPNDSDLALNQGAYSDHCLQYKECIDSGALDCKESQAANMCHLFFANPDQRDGNANNRGDRCETRPSGQVIRFERKNPWSISSNEVICNCSGGIKVDVKLEGGWIDTSQGIDFNGVGQRTTVGACGCTMEQAHGPDCDNLWCRRNDERDANGDLAWEAIWSGDGLLMDQVDEVDPAYPPTLHVDEVSLYQGNPRYIINKHDVFSHSPVGNERSFWWDLTHYQKEDLTGQRVWSRIAWQDPEQPAYTYYSYPTEAEYTVDFSKHYLDIKAGDYTQNGDCTCISSYWRVAHPLGGVGTLEDMVRLMVKPWGYTDPPRDLSPWVMTTDQVSKEPLLVTLEGREMRMIDARTVSTSTGSGYKLDQSFPSVTSAMLDSRMFGLEMSEVPVIFQYGGYETDGSVSNALWFGFPANDSNLWLRAEEVYGLKAAEGPAMTRPGVVYHAGGKRLVVIGSRTARDIIPESRLEVWTFDLKTGRWKNVRRPEGVLSFRSLSISLDPLRNRAILVGGPDQVRTYSLNLDTLTFTELNTTPCEDGPVALAEHGAYLEPTEQALYVYGGRDARTFSTKAFRLDLLTGRWTYLGDGSDGPGERLSPFVSYDRMTRTLKVAGGSGSQQELGVVFWGLRDGKWLRNETLKGMDLDGWSVQGTFDISSAALYPLFTPDIEPFPGKLLIAHLSSSDPNLGLEVRDSAGKLVGADLAASADNYTAFWAHSLYMLRVVPGLGFDPGHNPHFTIDVSEAELSELCAFEGSEGVNDIMVKGDIAYLVGTKGMDVVSLVDPTAPALVSHVFLGGKGQSIEPCGEMACVAQTWGFSSLTILDIGDPEKVQVKGGVYTPGLSRSLAVKRGRWVYVADGFFGVSIIDSEDPTKPLRVGAVHPGGLVLDVKVSADRLYVATTLPRKVKIYDIAYATSPVFLGEFASNRNVETMLVRGKTLHVAEATMMGWPGCLTGLFCPRGRSVVVYDVSDPSSVKMLEEYDGWEQPMVHMKSWRNHVLVRTYNGFKIFQAVPMD